MFNLIGWQAKLAEYVIVILVVGAVFCGVYYKGYNDSEKEAIVAQAQADKAARAKYNKIEKELEAKKSVRQQNAQVITKQVEKIVERPVYIERCWDDDGLQRANEAISGRNQSKPETTLSSDTTR